MCCVCVGSEGVLVGSEVIFKKTFILSLEVIRSGPKKLLLLLFGYALSSMENWLIVCVCILVCSSQLVCSLNS